MVFRRDNKADAFQRQINALRQQLGTDADRTDADVTALDRADGPGAEQTEGDALGASSLGTRDASEFSLGRFGVSSPVDRSPAPMPPPANPVISPPPAGAQTSIVAHDATWKGDLASDGTIHLHGRVEGSVTAKEDVYIAEEAEVDATISATNVVIAGLVKGAVRCTARFEVLPQGRVTGDIQAPTLVVHEGAVVAGQFHMGMPHAMAQTGPQQAPVIDRRTARGG